MAYFLLEREEQQKEELAQDAAVSLERMKAKGPR